MGTPRTSKSTIIAVRLPVSELEVLESVGNRHGLTRHAVIRYLLTDAIRSGHVNTFKAKTPA